MISHVDATHVTIKQITQSILSLPTPTLIAVEQMNSSQPSSTCMRYNPSAINGTVFLVIGHMPFPSVVTQMTVSKRWWKLNTLTHPP